MNSIILATAVLSFAAGTGVLYANPRRFLNQVFALALALLAVWIGWSTAPPARAWSPVSTRCRGCGPTPAWLPFSLGPSG